MKTTADIIIIGAGCIGCSTAYHLGNLGTKDVVVLDRGDVCSGETAKSGGFVQTHWESLDEVRLINRSRELFWEWEEKFGTGCSFTETGYLHVTDAEGVEKVRRTHDMLLAEGIESEWLEQRDIKRLQPIINVRDLAGGTYEKRSGWANPKATTQSMARAAQDKGAHFELNTQVLQIAHRGGKIEGVETDKGFISSRCVILCAGPWTPLLHPLPSIPLPIRAKRGQVCYTNRPGGMPTKELTFYDEVTGLYTHCDGDQNLVGIDYHFEEIWDPDRYNKDIDQDYVDTALQALGFRFPAMCNAQLQRGVVGLYDFTPDGHPIIDGPIGLEGYYVAAGFSGAGFKSSPMHGLGIAEMVLHGKASSVNMDFLSFSRFRETDDWIDW